MADIRKHTASAVGRLFLHNNRSPNDGVQHSNETIDPERTKFNYHLKKGDTAALRERLEEVYIARRNDRSNVVLCEAVVTLPKDVKQGDERLFFESVYDFYAKDFGEENIVNAVVHMDEKTPHIHFDFVPVVTHTEPACGADSPRYAAQQKWMQEHGGKLERLCAKDVINRSYLRMMHERLSKHIEKELGYKTEILNGATINGNKKVLQLKAETLQKTIEGYEKRLHDFQQESEELHRTAERWGISENDVGLLPLMQKIDELETRNLVLQEIIAREGYHYKADDLKRIRQAKFTPSKAASVSVYDGSLVNAEIENNAIIVIEVPKSKHSPQQKLIDSDADLLRQYRFACASSTAVSMKRSMVDDRIYLFIKPDTQRQTLDCILEMERLLRENEEELKERRLYIDRIEADRYDLARTVLNTMEFRCSYFARRDLEEKESAERAKEKMLS